MPGPPAPEWSPEDQLKRRLEHDLFRRIALRFVKTGGRLGDAKDIGDAVIANTVAGTEIPVRVVVERAPADAPCIPLVGCELIVYARMPQRVLRHALDLVFALGRNVWPYEFGVQVKRMIRRPQRKAEIVHREHVFEQLRIVEVTNAAGLPRCGPARAPADSCACRNRDCPAIR